MLGKDERGREGGLRACDSISTAFQEGKAPRRWKEVQVFDPVGDATLGAAESVTGGRGVSREGGTGHSESKDTTSVFLECDLRLGSIDPYRGSGRRIDECMSFLFHNLFSFGFGRPLRTADDRMKSNPHTGIIDIFQHPSCAVEAVYVLAMTIQTRRVSTLSEQLI